MVRAPVVPASVTGFRERKGVVNYPGAHQSSPVDDQHRTIAGAVVPRWATSVAPSQLPQSIGLRPKSREPEEVNPGFDSGFTPGGYMFDSLADQIKHDEQEQVNSAERFLRWAAIAVLSFVAFGGLYLGIHLLP